MIDRFVHRRFGRGAGRLRLGRPANVPGLTRSATAPSFLGRMLQAAPLLALLLSPILLGDSPQPAEPDPQLASTRAVQPEPTRLRLLEPTLPGPNLARPATAEVPTPPPAEEARRSALRIASTPTAPQAESTAAGRPARLPIDALLPSAPSVPADFDTPNASTPRRATRRPSLGGAAPVSEAIASLAPGPARRSPESFATTTGTTPDAGAQRVRPGSRAGKQPSAIPTPADSSALRARSEFLTALTREAEERIAPAARNEVPPAVAARSAASRAIENTLTSQFEGAGWASVPLDELPDCSPPGRQDALKRAVLRAAHGRQACARDDAEFRFLQTRNLNAFLMWSRPETDALRRSNPKADACDVLERALWCLEGVPTKELDLP